MAVTKRTRYEVLRRDDNTCRYCHATDSPLTIDHVIPTTLGGSDNPENLVACCRDCNFGKSSSAPDAALVAQVDADALRWAAAMRLAVEQQRWDRQALENHLAPFVQLWGRLTPADLDEPRYQAPEDWRERIVAILKAGLPMETLLEATRVAFASRADNVFWYLLGVANNKLADLNVRARVLLDQGAV